MMRHTRCLVNGKGTLLDILSFCDRAKRISCRSEDIENIQSFRDYIYFSKAWAIDKKIYNSSKLWNKHFGN